MHIDEFSKLASWCPAIATGQLALTEAKKRWPEAKGYQDYREMIDKRGRILTPASSAFPSPSLSATILAMKAARRRIHRNR